MYLNLELTPPLAGGANGVASRPDARVRVDGKRLTRHGRGFRVQGVTYGPFARPGWRPAAGADRVATTSPDADAQVNALRTYHIRGSFLGSPGARPSVFIDVPWPKHLCFLDSHGPGRRPAVRRAAGRHDSVRA